MAKHSPNTSEYSKPHSSKAEPREHVDQLHFGSKGEHVKEHDVHHITDKGAIDMGRQTYERHTDSSSSDSGK